ncbi:Vitamin D3 receptor [Folsomia candida]|uniref:Vitamin D3 receptor n=1 Tax=Folsomia candida TaxID=158441 RepID=A0A226DGM4_FOLCA|nr:Vitamin D3 receptor [Folsomia candida]
MGKENRNVVISKSGNLTSELAPRKRKPRLRVIERDRCLSIGMEPAWVISDYNRTKESSKNTKAVENQKIEAVKDIRIEVSIPPSAQGLSAEEAEIINNIPKFYKKACELIPYNYVSRSKTEVLTKTKIHILNIGMISTSIRRFVCFARMLPEFERLSLHDQANLLRRSVLEMGMIRGVFTFNIEKRGCFYDADNLPEKYPEVHLDECAGLYPEELTEMNIQLFRRIRSHAPDEASIMLLIPLVLFSDFGGNDSCTEFDDRPGINAAQEFYTGLLQKYLKHVFGEKRGRLEFPRLLAKLVDITQVGQLYQGFPLKLTEDQVDKMHKHLLELQRVTSTSPLTDNKYFWDRNNLPEEKLIKQKDCCKKYMSSAKILDALRHEKTVEHDKNAPAFPFLIHVFASNPGQWGVQPYYFLQGPHKGVERALMRRMPELVENPLDSLVKHVSELRIS